MNYCILRIKKLTSFGSIAGSAKHTFREIPTPNADASRTHLNWTSGAQTSAEVCAAIMAALPAKRRKDAVLCIEYLFTATPEWFESTPEKAHCDYVDGALAWLRQRHGAANIVCLNLQLDEKSPHLVAYVVPLTKDGRLSAKDFLGGRAKLSAMQTDFWTTVGRPAGLDRGLEGSTAKHTTAKQYSAALARNPMLEQPAPPVLTLADRVTGRARRMQEEYQVALEAHTRLVEQARAEALLGRRSREQQSRALAKLRAEFDVLQGAKDEAVRLADENRRLVLELERQKKSFAEQMAALRQMFEQAAAKVKQLLSRSASGNGKRRRRGRRPTNCVNCCVAIQPSTNRSVLWSYAGDEQQRTEPTAGQRRDGSGGARIRRQRLGVGPHPARHQGAADGRLEQAGELHQFHRPMLAGQGERGPGPLIQPHVRARLRQPG